MCRCRMQSVVVTWLLHLNTSKAVSVFNCRSQWPTDNESRRTWAQASMTGAFLYRSWGNPVQSKNRRIMAYDPDCTCTLTRENLGPDCHIVIPGHVDHGRFVYDLKKDNIKLTYILKQKWLYTLSLLSRTVSQTIQKKRKGSRTGSIHNRQGREADVARNSLGNVWLPAMFLVPSPPSDHIQAVTFGAQKVTKIIKSMEVWT